MNARFSAARRSERNAEMRVIGCAEALVGAKLDERAAELHVGKALQGHGVGGAVSPSEWFGRETPVSARAAATVDGAVRAQNDSSAPVVAGEREVIFVIHTAKTPVADLDEAVASAQSGSASVRIDFEVDGIDGDGSRAERGSQNAKNRNVLHFECSKR